MPRMTNRLVASNTRVTHTQLSRSSGVNQREALLLASSLPIVRNSRDHRLQLLWAGGLKRTRQVPCFHGRVCIRTAVVNRSYLDQKGELNAGTDLCSCVQENTE